jgi:hypothetical protein
LLALDHFMLQAYLLTGPNVLLYLLLLQSPERNKHTCLQGLTSCCCHLLLLLLQSPEKFQRSLAELTSAVEAERSVVEDTDRTCSDVMARQEMVGKVREATLCVYSFCWLQRDRSTGWPYTATKQT